MGIVVLFLLVLGLVLCALGGIKFNPREKDLGWLGVACLMLAIILWGFGPAHVFFPH